MRLFASILLAGALVGVTSCAPDPAKPEPAKPEPAPAAETKEEPTSAPPPPAVDEIARLAQRRDTLVVRALVLSTQRIERRGRAWQRIHARTLTIRGPEGESAPKDLGLRFINRGTPPRTFRLPAIPLGTLQKEREYWLALTRPGMFGTYLLAARPIAAERTRSAQTSKQRSDEIPFGPEIARLAAHPHAVVLLAKVTDFNVGGRYPERTVHFETTRIHHRGALTYPNHNYGQAYSNGGEVFFGWFGQRRFPPEDFEKGGTYWLVLSNSLSSGTWVVARERVGD